jgi:hypothetical protein
MDKDFADFGRGFVKNTKRNNQKFAQIFIFLNSFAMPHHHLGTYDFYNLSDNSSSVKICSRQIYILYIAHYFVHK